MFGSFACLFDALMFDVFVDHMCLTKAFFLSFFLQQRALVM